MRQFSKKHQSWIASWSLKHTFFVIMGGDVVPIYDPTRDETPEPWHQVTITSKGFIALLKAHVDVPMISATSIACRSTADTFAKVFSCVQATYVIFECIGRLAVGLPITLLELNVLGHIGCALLRFFFWWEKALNMRDPVSIRCPGIDAWASKLKMDASNDRQLVRLQSQAKTIEALKLLPELDPDASDTYFGSSSDIQAPQPIYPFDYILHNRDPEWADFQNTSATNAVLLLSYVPIEITQQVLHDILRRYKYLAAVRKIFWTTRLTLHPVHVRPSLVTRWWQIGLGGVESSAEVWFPAPRSANRHWIFELSYHIIWLSDLEGQADKIRILAAVSGKRNSSQRPSLQPDSDHTSLLSSYEKSSAQDADLLVDEAPAKPTGTAYLYDADVVGGWSRLTHLSLILLIAATCLYGALHIAAWNSHFTTNSEEWLWRTSAALIGASGFAVAVWFSLLPVFSELSSKYLKDPFKVTEKWYFDALQVYAIIVLSIPALLAAVVAVLLLLCYVAARAFIVVEAFICLRSQPPSAYVVSSWASWFPHL